MNKSTRRQHVDVDLQELDRIIDGAMQAPRELSAVNRPSPVQHPVVRSDILFQSGFLYGGEGSVFGLGSLARSARPPEPPQSRFCLSHFPPRRATCKRTGPMQVARRSCVIARFVCKSRSSDMGAGASRRMTKITTGSRSGAEFAICVGKRSRFCRPSPCLTATTA